MFKKAKKEPAATERCTVAISTSAGKATLEVRMKSDCYTTEYQRFRGSLAEATAFTEALLKALAEASRVEGALATIYPA